MKTIFNDKQIHSYNENNKIWGRNHQLGNYEINLTTNNTDIYENLVSSIA